MSLTTVRKSSALMAVALAFVLIGQGFAQTGPIGSTGSTGPSKGDLYVLSVGVNHPAYMASQKPLRSAYKDALAHEAFWARQHKLFNTVNVPAALTNEKATARAILDGLDQIVKAAKQGDTVVLPLAGHGGVNRATGEWVFCAYDSHVGSAALRSRIEALARKGVRVLLILDTCESGGVGISGDNIIVLAACTADQGAIDGKDHGLFTRVLLDGLNGAADLNKDGVITLAELTAYVSLRVEQLSKQIDKEQCPTCGTPPNLRSNLPLATVPAAAADPVPKTGTGPIARP
jgi:hypothetical protein